MAEGLTRYDWPEEAGVTRCPGKTTLSLDILGIMAAEPLGHQIGRSARTQYV